MNILTILPLVFWPLEVDSLVWTVSSEWSTTNEIESFETWNLNALNAGTYRVWGCATEPFAELTLDMRWRQDLNGSNNNHSRIFLTESPPVSFLESEFLPVGSLSFSTGTNGSEDPLEISNSPFDVFQEIPPALLNYAEPFDLDFSVRYSKDSSYSSIRAGTHDSGWSLPISHIALSNSNEIWAPRCIGFEATCTSSNTDAFSWSLQRLEPQWLPLENHRILTHKSIDSTSIEIMWNRPSPVGLTVETATQETHVPGKPHHSVFTGMNPLIDGSSVDCRVSTNEIDTVLQVVWADSNAVNFREITLTELFVDATPSVGLPEVEWMEVLNQTDRIINVNGWGLVSESATIESGIIRAILPKNNWNGYLPPHARFLICAAPFATTESLPDLGYVSEVEGWSGLSDNGMTLSLLRPDGTLIDGLTYDRSWWNGKSLAALSVSKIHPEGCGLASNWEPTFLPLGATPWERGELEANAPQITPPISISAHLVNPQKVAFLLQPDIDPLSELKCQFINEENEEEAYWESPYWVVNLESPISEGKPIDIIIEEAQLCTNGINTQGATMDWIPALPPEWGDLVISEFLTNPSPESPWDEWVEIVNISNRTLDLEGLQLGEAILKVGQYLNVDSVLVLEPNCMDSWRSLSENSGQIKLSIRRNQLSEETSMIDLVEYSRCWHDDREKAEGGHSLERVNYFLPANTPNNWISGTGVLGCSRGIARPLDFEMIKMESLRDTNLIWGSLEGHLCWHSPYSMDSCVLFSENWDPPIEWKFASSSSNIAVSEQSIYDLGSIENIVEIACYTWKEISDDHPTRTNAWTIEIPSENTQRDFILNEVLSDPLPGKSKFVEILNSSDHVKSTSGVIVTTHEQPLPNDWSELTEIGWWTLPQEILAFAECPSWVDNTSVYSRIIQADLPSLTNGRIMGLMSTLTGFTDEVEINSSTDGVSQERYNVSEDIWVNAPNNKGGSSPGMDNFSSVSQHENTVVNSRQHPLIITPKTIEYNATSNFKWAILEWEPPENVGMWSVAINIFTSNGEWATTLTEEGEEVESKKIWIFEGENLSGGKLFPGTYIAVLEASNIDTSEKTPKIKKIMRRGLIQVN
ncbi:MAG: hypothetical protein OSA04_00885 [Flavobacteriales bacterium]|nr:hypothetical protein [Flavobacteriales bacterium]